MTDDSRLTVHEGRWTLEHRFESPWHYLPVEVGPGTAGLRVELEYEQAGETVLDLGCLGPAGFRGWSGGARSWFAITAEEATPGYLPGELETGLWQVMIGLYRVPPDGVPYRVTVRASGHGAGLVPSAPAAPPVPGKHNGKFFKPARGVDKTVDHNGIAVKIPGRQPGPLHNVGPWCVNPRVGPVVCGRRQRILKNPALGYTDVQVNGVRHPAAPQSNCLRILLCHRRSYDHHAKLAVLRHEDARDRGLGARTGVHRLARARVTPIFRAILSASAVCAGTLPGLISSESLPRRSHFAC